MAEGNGRQGYRDDTGRDDRRDESRGRDAPATKTKAVFALTERAGKTYWNRIGIAFVNKDLSLTVRLDAFPVSGQLNIRDDDAQSDRRD